MKVMDSRLKRLFHSYDCDRVLVRGIGPKADEHPNLSANGMGGNPW